MLKEPRRELTDEEKRELLEKHTCCYICNELLEGYSGDEIQFDHIYNYAAGYLRISEQIGRRHGGKWPPCRRKVATVSEQIGQGGEGSRIRG